MDYLSNYKFQLNDSEVTATFSKNNIYIRYSSKTYGNVQFNIIKDFFVRCLNFEKNVLNISENGRYINLRYTTIIKVEGIEVLMVYYINIDVTQVCVEEGPPESFGVPYVKRFQVDKSIPLNDGNVFEWIPTEKEVRITTQGKTIISIPYVEAYKLMKTVFSSDSIYLYYKKGVILKYNYLVNVAKYELNEVDLELNRDIEYNVMHDGKIVKPTILSS